MKSTKTKRVTTKQIMSKLEGDKTQLKVVTVLRSGVWTNLEDSEAERYLKILLTLRHAIRCFQCGKTVAEGGFGAILFTKEDMSDGVFLCEKCQYTAGT
ncbi:MAG: hypothetical protein QXI42_11590 [Thermoproteota archaeon]